MLDANTVRVLYIDLGRREWRVDERPELARYLGGVGVAARLFTEGLVPDAEASAPEQPVVLGIGPLTTVFPMATKTAAVFRSPLTGEWGESYAGMRLAMALRFAGYDAVYLTGRAQRPVYLVVDRDGVSFKDARGLWGLDCEETGRCLREWEQGRGFRSIVRIGPAGERGVAFAGVNVDTVRHFGRLGLGAVMGAKNLKAMVVHGEKSIPIPDRRAYRAVYEEIHARAVDTEVMEKYHGLGTAGNVLSLNAMGALPTRNLRENRFEGAERICGEAFAQKTLIRKLACPGCPVGCIHVGLYRRSFAEGHEYESITLAYDYELIYALGSFLGLSEPGDVYALIEAVEALGLDAISSGVVLGWATEALEKGLIHTADLAAELRFGDLDGYLAALRGLVEQPTPFYAVLARGLHRATAELGGRDFACLLGNNEMAGYHTGYAFILGQTVGARHSHLCNAGYALDQEPGLTEDPDGVVDRLIAEEEWRNVLNSLAVCLFARNIYDPPTVVRALNALGVPAEAEDLARLGAEIFDLKLAAKKRMGFDLSQVTVPRRYFETPTLQGTLREDVLGDLLSRYRARIAARA